MAYQGDKSSVITAGIYAGVEGDKSGVTAITRDVMAIKFVDYHNCRRLQDN